VIEKRLIFAAPHESGFGTFRSCRHLRPMSANEGISEAQMLTASISHISPIQIPPRTVRIK
jgi:hypothetical protein